MFRVRILCQNSLSFHSVRWPIPHSGCFRIACGGNGTHYTIWEDLDPFIFLWIINSETVEESNRPLQALVLFQVLLYWIMSCLDVHIGPSIPGLWIYHSKSPFQNHHRILSHLSLFIAHKIGWIGGITLGRGRQNIGRKICKDLFYIKSLQPSHCNIVVSAPTCHADEIYFPMLLRLAKNNDEE